MTNRTLPETPVGGPLGDTGDGNTGVPADKQGISNRPGDRASGSGSPAQSVADEDDVDVEDFDDDVTADDDAADDAG